MPSYENMNLQGIMSYTKAYNEHLRGAPSTSKKPMIREARSKAYAPSTPPLPLEWENEASSHLEPIIVSFVPIKRIMIDQEYKILYRNSVGLFYSTPMSPKYLYPFENLVKVHHDIGETPFHLKMIMQINIGLYIGLN